MRRSRDTSLTPIQAILPGIVNPAEAAKERVKAILDKQARQSEVERSIRRLGKG